MAEQELQQLPPTEDEWDKLAKKISADKKAETETDAAHPVRSFWDKLVHGNPNESRTKEVTRSAARGAVGAVKETAAAVGESGMSVAGLPVSDIAKGASKAAGAVQNLFGRKSDDVLASFTESAVQFALPFAATGPMGVAADAGKVAQVVSAAGRGAVVDATAFDPNDAGLAELLARIPVPGLRDLGKALSVKGDDSEIIKRMKRGAAGIVPAVALDATIAGIQRVWARGAGKAGEQISEEAGKTLAAISDGTHVPDGAHVKVVPTEDGHFEIKPVHEDLAVEKSPEGVTLDAPKFTDRAEAEQQAETINAAMNERVHAAQQAGGLTQSQAEELRSTFQKFLTATDAESLQALTEGTHFNFSYISEPKETLSAIESVSRIFKEELDKAQITDGVTIDAHARRVSQFLDGLAPEQAPALLTRALSNGGLGNVPQSVILNAADVVLRDVALKTARLFDVVTARPHDVIAWEEARLAASNLVQLQKALSGANSEAGRALKFLQDRDAVAAAARNGDKEAFKQNAAETLSEHLPIKAGSQRALEPTVNVEAVTKAKAAVEDAVKEVKSSAAKPGPNTSTVLDDAARPVKEGEGKPTPVERQGLADGTLDTQGATASDFSRARARAKALAALKQAQTELKKHGVDFEPEVLADNRSLRGERVKMQGDAQLESPLSGVPAGTKGPKNPIEDLSRWLDDANNQLDEVLKRPAKTKAEQTLAEEVASMSEREILAVLKMAKRAGGSPSKLGAIKAGATVIKETGVIRRALEVFVNSALSNPATHATALTMNTMVSTYEAASKMFSGALTANRGLMREGWDTLVANEMFLKDNFATAMMAFRQGHSVLNPGEVHVAIPGKIGEVIRTPAKGLLFTDEFTRVTNYRSFVYAKSLRYWRERGLEGEGLAKAVQSDLRDAFDAKTGVATIPDALKYAKLPTMSADLGRDTFGGGLASFLNNHIEAKFIAPFVKTSINVFRYTFDRTPLLNRLAARNRAILSAGGEAANTLATQSGLATAVGTYAYMKAKSGEVTGAGPKDPGLRRLWLQDHKPHSIKIDGEWVSYNRLQPLATPLSLLADVHDMVQELGQSGRETDGEDIIAASLAGLAASFGNQTYMTGMTQFFEAWSGGKGDMMKKWLQGFGTTFTDPQLLRAFNDDPYLREVQSFKDAMMAGIPGLSEKLPARYDLFGEPILATHSLMPAPVKGKVQSTVASDLLTLGKGIVPVNRNQINGVPVDLADGGKFGKVQGLTPYEYIQQKLREPGDGDPGLKQALTDLVKTDDWKEASPGSELYPGGERFIMAYKIIDSYRRRAIGSMLDRFPSVQREVEMQKQIKGASTAEGQKGALDVLREYGKK